MIAGLAHRAWAALNRGRWQRFQQTLDDPGAVQESLLRSYLDDNAGTVVGRRHGFSTIDSIRTFQERVPVVTWDNLAPDVDRLCRGEQGVLTREGVLRLLPSSGSTAARKLIPYTRRSRTELQRAVGPWIVDLYRRRPGAFSGRAYWSISPLADAFADEAAALPIGFDDDSAYLGGVAARLVHRVLAVPPAVRHLADVEEFRRTTLRYLLNARDLTLISVWHPSFLTLLLDAVSADWDLLLASLPRRRAAELERLGPDRPAAFWPGLAVISCWRDAHAAAPARALEVLFPDVAVEAKGLLATEAVVSVPFEGARVLAVRSHFFEFLDDRDRPHLAADLRLGGEYEVVVTTGGGLYRYRLGDRVRVDGFRGRTPCLTFLGRADRVSDRRGEKLNEVYVASRLRQVLEPLDLDVRFAMLAPEEDGASVFYTLFLESGRTPPDGLAERLDDALAENPHYRLCRKLGQLAPARVLRVARGAHQTYLEHMRRQGRRLGDVKPAVLDTAGGWRRRFTSHRA